MAGNEIAIAKYLLNKRNCLTLRHIGLVKSIGAPSGINVCANVNSIDELAQISTEDSRKKADIYINGRGVSLKQTGASFPFNRLRRADMLDVFSMVGCSSPDVILAKLDAEVDKFHSGQLSTRKRPWKDFFTEEEFKQLTRYLMLKGSPKYGHSPHPADFILEAPRLGIDVSNIAIYSFDEYFDKYVRNLFVSIRRQWIGQASKSEHNRALRIASEVGNHKWVYKTISGKPRTGWRANVTEKDRRTVYMIFLEKGK